MPDQSPHKPVLLWVFRDQLGKSPLELDRLGRRRPTADLVPVLVVPLAMISDTVRIESQLAEIEIHGLRINVNVIAGRTDTAQAWHAKKKRT